MGLALIILPGYLVSSKGIQKGTMCQFCNSSKEYPGRRIGRNLAPWVDRDGQREQRLQAGGRTAPL